MKKDYGGMRHGLGFDDKYITLLKGDQSLYEDYLRESPARYNTIFGWYFPHWQPLPQDLPAGLEPVVFPVEKAFNGPDRLPEKELQYNVQIALYGGSTSEYVGSIGERIDITAKCVYVRTSESFYGAQNFHLFEDQDGNILSWSTTSRLLEVGKTYKFRATIKTHEYYKNQKQTVLTRAMSFKEVTK